MAIKVYNPTSPGRRDASTLANEEITKREPEKSLVLYKKKRAGRNNEGKVTVHHQGGGVKQLLRIIDFKRDKLGIPGKVSAIEYDPGSLGKYCFDLLCRWRKTVYNCAGWIESRGYDCFRGNCGNQSG